MTIKMRPHVDSKPCSIIICTTYGSGNIRSATLRAETVCQLAIDTARICLKALTDVDLQIGVRSISDAIFRALATPTKAKGGIEDLGFGEFASIFGFIPPSSVDSN
jgi:hypothetical protein